ncbi:MAG: phosphoglycerate kinase [Planctomycetes bacterium]|nr:phosphoglycerate kinase [Planctomycetota bacterium]
MDFSKIPGIDSLGDLKGKRVFLRADFNVPLEGETITSDQRIRAALPTIQLLQSKGAQVILASHLGRPEGNGFEKEFSLKPVAKRLSELLGSEVPLIPDCVGENTRKSARGIPNGHAALLENLRFHKAEKKGSEVFGRELASYADAYVNDAFGTCHRGDASMVWPAKVLPSAAGLLVKAEVDAMARVLENPARPCLAVLGGAKVSDKIPLVNNLIDKVNEICIGGGMAYTFLLAEGIGIGNSLCDDTLVEECRQIIAKAADKGVILHLPTDHVVAGDMEDEQFEEVNGDVPEGKAAFDIGGQTLTRFADAIKRAKTILFNGPMGVFEKERFSNGSKGIISAIAAATESGAFSVIGGGDSAAAVEHFGLENKMSHVSTGGGASLTLLQGGEMPALEALIKPGA